MPCPNEHDVAGLDRDAVCVCGAVELVGTDRKTRLEMGDTHRARDVEQDRAPNDAAREMMDAEALRTAGRGDQPGPETVVERPISADVPEPVNLRRSLQGHE